jgi:hypothetical protein
MSIYFKPTWLYIKQHNLTKLKYFGKTINKDPVKYKGSGKHWTRHINKYGNDVMDSSGKKKQTAPEYRKVPVVKPGKTPKWIEMDPKMKGVNFEIRLVEDFEVTQNKSYRIEIAKSLLDEAKSNPLINADESTIDYLEALGKNPDKYYLKPKPQAVQFQNGQGLPPENPMPGQGAQINPQMMQ